MKNIRQPEISIIVPVFKEESRINEVLFALKQAGGNIRNEIIVCDGHHDKTTIKAIKQKNIVKVHSAKGRAIQMNAGAKKALTGILVFVHADTIMPEGFLASIKTAIKSGSRAGSFTFALDAKGAAYRFMEKWVQTRDAITREPFGDRSHFFEKKYFHSIGGYADIPLMEDIEIMRRIKRCKGNIVILKEKAVTSARKIRSEGFIFYAVRNWFLRLLYNLGISPSLLAKIYYRKEESGNA